MNQSEKKEDHPDKEPSHWANKSCAIFQRSFTVKPVYNGTNHDYQGILISKSACMTKHHLGPYI